MFPLGDVFLPLLSAPISNQTLSTKATQDMQTYVCMDALFCLLER